MRAIRQLSLLSNTESDALPYILGEGCGNTFLIFDCLDLPHVAIQSIMQKAHAALLKEARDDALILRQEYLDEDKLVLTMIVLEPDQSIAEFCGNGARVVGRYLKHKFGDRKRDYYLQTSRGMRRLWWKGDVFHVDMGVTKLHSTKGKFFHLQDDTFRLGLGMRQFHFFWTETLEPHLITFDDISEKELCDLGLYLNQHQRNFFPFGVNLNKAEVLSSDMLRVTTFERGVNRITAACGTGATSCVMLAKSKGRVGQNCNIQVLLKGGVIIIHPRKRGAIMSGPAYIN